MLGLSVSTQFESNRERQKEWVYMIGYIIKIKVFFICLALFLSSSDSYGKDNFENYFNRGQSLSASIADKTPSYDIKFFLPDRLESANNETEIANQIFSHTLKNWFKELTEMKTSAAMLAKSIDESINPKFELKTSVKDQVKHSVKLSFILWKQEIAVKYSGFANVKLKLDVSDGSTCIDISEKITEDINISFSHHEYDFGYSDKINFKYVF